MLSVGGWESLTLARWANRRKIPPPGGRRREGHENSPALPVPWHAFVQRTTNTEQCARINTSCAALTSATSLPAVFVALITMMSMAFASA